MYQVGQTVVSRRLPAKEFTIIQVIGPSVFIVKNENGAIYRKTTEQVYLHPMHWQHTA